jgi:hypothetical protein
MAVLWKILLPIPGRSVRCFMVRDCGELVDGIFGKGVILDSATDAEDAMGYLCYSLIWGDYFGNSLRAFLPPTFFSLFFGVVRECTCRLWLDEILELGLGWHGLMFAVCLFGSVFVLIKVFFFFFKT